MQLNSLEYLRSEIGRNVAYWRARLLRPGDLATLGQRYGMGQFRAEDIMGLWRIGLLRADMILSSKPIDDPGMPSLAEQDEEPFFAYYDMRQAAHRAEGYGSAFANLCDVSSEDREPLFHPYRVYILFHVHRTLKVETSSTQYLLYEPGVMSVTQRLLEFRRDWTSSLTFGERFHHWNIVTEIAITAEPISYGVIYLDHRPTSYTEPATDPYEKSVRDMFASIDRSEILRMRQDLAFCAEQLDDNRSVHVLLRLMNARERNNLKGQLGGSMHLLAMAESIRRAAERAYGEALPEEDEIGPGTWFPGARKMLYGNARVFDAPPQDLRDYLTHLGIDFAVKVRCYVEGETELGAINHAVGDMGHVQLVNLAGNVAERARKGLAFAESLAADKEAGIFSVVMLDGDREEYVRILRRAAQEERFHGCFFVSDPDFELGNFTPQELIEIAMRLDQHWVANLESDLPRKVTLLKQASRISNNKELFSLLREYESADVRKSESWGKELMTHAIMRPHFPADHIHAGQERPIVETIKVLLRMRRISFLDSLSMERVDPTSGRAVARTPRADRQRE